MHRVGIIPFETRETGFAVLFVTSQTRGRWILPKGKMKDGESHVDTCHREGFEEAGVRGTVLEDFPITVVVTKLTPEGELEVPVTYYPYLVTEQVPDWPERTLRERHWELLEHAADIDCLEDYVALIRRFEDLKPWIMQAAHLLNCERWAEPLAAS